MKKYLFSLLALLALNACGPSASDTAQIEQTAREELLRQQEYARQQEALKKGLIELKARLAGEETKLQSIGEFHLLRTKDEKAQQVADQAKVIEKLKVKITEVENQIEN
jgi:hypothetical protein